MSDDFGEAIHTAIWEEEANPVHPYSADACFCRGYDVYGDLLGRASLSQYLHLLFKGEQPSPQCLAVLDTLAVAIANPGPRDPSVHAAMAAGVGGSTAASVLMAALAVGAGSLGGAREVYLVMQAWRQIGDEVGAWSDLLASPRGPVRAEVWPQIEHPPGFDPYGTVRARPVAQTMDKLAALVPDGRAAWLRRHAEQLEAATERPLAMTAVAAAGWADIGCSPEEGEMLTLLLRLPGAAAHALEQKQRGFRQFPFFRLDLQNDPGPARKEPA